MYRGIGAGAHLLEHGSRLFIAGILVRVVPATITSLAEKLKDNYAFLFVPLKIKVTTCVHLQTAGPGFSAALKRSTFFPFRAVVPYPMDR
jgi:putative effector of murein hydrolase LrgA (UPF0299 family)